MTDYKIVVKKDCYFCKKLLKWLKDKDVEYQVIDYQDPKYFDDPLMKNHTFTSLYCDMGACVESIPLIVKKNKNEDTFYYGEIWDLRNNEIIEKKANEIFGLG